MRYCEDFQYFFARLFCPSAKAKKIPGLNMGPEVFEIVTRLSYAPVFRYLAASSLVTPI